MSEALSSFRQGLKGHTGNEKIGLLNIQVDLFGKSDRAVDLTFISLGQHFQIIQLKSNTSTLWKLSQ